MGKLVVLENMIKIISNFAIYVINFYKFIKSSVCNLPHKNFWCGGKIARFLIAILPCNMHSDKE